MLVSVTCITSALTSSAGTKLSTAARSPVSTQLRSVCCHSRPPVSVQASSWGVWSHASCRAEQPAADQGPQPAARTQKFRPVVRSTRVRSEAGASRKVF